MPRSSQQTQRANSCAIGSSTRNSPQQTINPDSSSTQSGGSADAEANDRWIDEAEASALTGLSRSWFQRSRWNGGGIPYTKLARACRYKLSEVHAFMNARRVDESAQAAA